jgi:hypothetical protein
VAARGAYGALSATAPRSTNCCRQAQSCPRVIACRRATTAIDAPDAKLSAKIWRFCSAVQ